MAVEKSFPVFGEPVEILVSSATSNGSFNVVTQLCEPGGGPPPHRHEHEDEYFTPMTGDFEMFDGEEWHPLGREGHYARRGEVHTFRNCGATPGQIRIVVSPGGLDEFLERISPLQVPQQMAEVIAISAEYGITYPGLGA